MKIVKIVYSEETKFILDIMSRINIKHIAELYDVSFHKDKKKAREIMERYGTKNIPLVVFEDENLQEYGAIWSESNPDWKSEIIKKLTDV